MNNDKKSRVEVGITGQDKVHMRPDHCVLLGANADTGVSVKRINGQNYFVMSIGSNILSHGTRAMLNGKSRPRSSSIDYRGA